MNILVTLRLRFTFVIVILAGLTCDAQTVLERPVGMVLSGTGAERQVAGEEGWHQVGPGVELFSGDLLRYANGSVTFAFCPSNSDATVQVLNSAATVRFRGQSLTPALNVTARPPVCLLPPMERAPAPSNQDDSRTRTPVAGTVEERIRNLPDGERSDVAPKLALADAMIQQPTLALLGIVTRAALLESCHLDRDALDLYRNIRDTTPDANWTGRVIERLTRNQLSRGLPTLNVAANPASLAPRRVGDPAASRLPGSLPNVAKGQIYGLLIGISAYNPLSGITNLHYADRDAASFRDYLKSTRGGGVPDDHIWMLQNEQATRDRIDQTLTEFVKGKAGSDNTLIVFVAAHGAYACRQQDLTYQTCQPGDENEEPVILVRETDPQNPRLTGFPMARLRDLLTQRAADFGRVVLYIDVCHAGNLRDPPPGGVALPATKAVKALQSPLGELGIMMASSVEQGQPDKELAYEDDNLKHGIFSYFVLTGLNGTVPSSSGTISFDQLYNHVSAQVSSFTGDRQAPDRFRTNSSLKVVDDAAIKGVDILEPAPDLVVAAPIARDAGRPEADVRFERAISANRFLPPDTDNASDALEQLRQVTGETSPLYLARVNQLRVALEERGQLIVIQYLQGEQVPQTEADFTLCATYFRRALELGPDAAFDRSRMLFCEGRALVFRKDYTAAAGLLERSIRMDPGHSYARNALGIAYLEQVPTDNAFFQPAIAAFRDAIRLAPYWAYPRHNLGLTLAQQGSYAQAEAEYVAAMRLAPRYSYLPYDLGLLRQSLNRIDDARASYQKAIAVATGRCADRSIAATAPCPERCAPLTAIASITGRRSRAVALFRSAIIDDPASKPARNDLAVLLSRQKSGWAEAETLWKTLLSIDPGYLPSLLAYSDLLRQQQRFDAVVPLYRAILQQLPGYVPTSIDLCLALLRTGSNDDAIRLLDDLLAKNQRNAEVWLARARFLEATGRKKEAGDARHTAHQLKRRSSALPAIASPSH